MTSWIARSGAGSVCHGNVPPGRDELDDHEDSPRKVPTAPSRALRAWRIATNVNDARTIRPSAPTGCATSMRRTRPTTASATTAWTAAASDGASHPASATLGERTRRRRRVRRAA